MAHPPFRNVYYYGLWKENNIVGPSERKSFHKNEYADLRFFSRFFNTPLMAIQ